MSAGASTLAPLPQAPTANAPAGLTARGAARVAWQPNVFTWVAVWRWLIVGEIMVSIVSGIASPTAWLAFGAAAGWSAASTIAALRPPSSGARRTGWLVFDLAACIGLLALTDDRAVFALLALFACSTVVAWASGRPVDSFIAAGIAGGAYTLLALIGPYAEVRPAEFSGNLSLFFFFALATSGFFTVAHRIGALEIATEISRERGRYRRDLHDRLGQALCGLHFEVQAVHAVGRDDQAASRMASLADGYRDAQSMLRDLFRGGDEPMVGTNVASVIQQEARRMAQQVGIRIDVDVTGDSSRVPPWMRPHIAAIAGESIHNSIKNGEASGIDVELDITDELIVLSVTDDGVGFDNPPGTITEKEGHYGLREMAERARICGGEVVIASQPGFGTRVRLQANLPDGAAEDILERDASKLRENVWSLFMILRVGLGLVALTQLIVRWPSSYTWVAAAMLAVMAIDIFVPAVRSKRTFAIVQRHPTLLYIPLAAYAVMLVAALNTQLTPVFMLYAPLVLLGAGVHGGRQLAGRMTGVFFAVLVIAAGVQALLLGGLETAAIDSILVYITNLALLGMCATQGSKLLDRLETLQIRVRFQALARLRQGLSNRMRDQLIKRLDQLEATSRTLSEDVPDEQEFSRATAKLQDESSELKSRLRDIVHQLADQTPGRTPINV